MNVMLSPPITFNAVRGFAAVTVHGIDWATRSAAFKIFPSLARTDGVH